MNPLSLNTPTFGLIWVNIQHRLSGWQDPMRPFASGVKTDWKSIFVVARPSKKYTFFSPWWVAGS
jgi:hypothetical protein